MDGGKKVEARLFSYRILALLLCAFSVIVAEAQVVAPVRPFSKSGKIKSNKDGVVTLTDTSGKVWPLRYSNRDDGRILIGRNLPFAAKKVSAEIIGTLGPAVLDKGMPIRFEGVVDDKGRIAKPVSKLTWADTKGFEPGVKVDRKQTDDQGATACQVSGMVDAVRRGRLTLRVPRSRYASKGVMWVPLAPDVKVEVRSQDLDRVQEGDVVSSVTGVELSTGDLIIDRIAIRLVEPEKERGKSNKGRGQEATPESAPVDRKYEKLSDEPVSPRDVRSQHYLVRTDLSDRKVRMLLDELETMVGLVSRYYGLPQPGMVQCYIVDDAAKWPDGAIPPEALSKIKNNEGLTASQTVVSSLAGRNTKATIYACSDFGVVRHEAVHAYCNLTFGSTGPTWYSEGMAEMGQYWEEGKREVDVNPRVIEFLRNTKEPKSLVEIVKEEQITGDSWQAYSWRWALCHLLANNPNYNRKFRDLGIGLMTNRPGITFEAAYGRVSRQLIFEFDQFIKNVGNGYRADLCAWRWKHRFKDVDGKGHVSVKVLAKSGWQPAVNVEKGATYDVIAKGEWQIDGSGTMATADGLSTASDSASVRPDAEINQTVPNGRTPVAETNAKEDSKATVNTGRLLGVVMRDFQLGDSIDIGAKGSFVATETGQLYLRCGEDWTRFGDNAGSVTVYVRKAK